MRQRSRGTGEQGKLLSSAPLHLRSLSSQHALRVSVVNFSRVSGCTRNSLKPGTWNVERLLAGSRHALQQLREVPDVLLPHGLLAILQVDRSVLEVERALYGLKTTPLHSIPSPPCHLTTTSEASWLRCAMMSSACQFTTTGGCGQEANVC
jgi:hypothetical protein